MAETLASMLSPVPDLADSWLQRVRMTLAPSNSLKDARHNVHQHYDLGNPFYQLWLDRELAGRGALQLAAIHDGMLHELRFTAPEHETKTLFFRDAPPAGRVLLNHVTEQKGAASNADVSPTSAAPRAPPERMTAARAQSRGAGAETEASARVARQRAAAAPAIAFSSPPPRARAAPPPSSQTKPARERSPRVELIEVHAPRVQVLD